MQNILIKVVISATILTGSIHSYTLLKENALKITNELNKQKIKASCQIYFEQHGEYPITEDNKIDIKKIEILDNINEINFDIFLINGSLVCINK